METQGNRPRGLHLLHDGARTVLHFLRFLEEHLVDRHACVGTSQDELDNLVGCGLRVRCLPEERDAVGEPRIVILGLRQAVFVLHDLRGRFEIAWSAVQLIEQCLGLLQVTRVEAFGEPTIDRSEQLPSLLRLALFAPETR